ncbi:MAG: hypothetical protein AUK44_03250 [Porphyromonadaceae bacterium CG2_30_38_12]|nr:MAG: hypothetical protein AUK44_03250 [Porphyromonadaceae bacterium CG2_30_38_12]
MRLLIVCSKNSGKIAPFISDQVEALQQAGMLCDYYCVTGKGWRGYLQNTNALIQKINLFKPNLLHAHFGLSGLLANLQRKVPVVTTYHGSDINLPKVYFFSRICMALSAYNIFVSQKNLQKANLKKRFALIPCGVDTSMFFPLEKENARKELGFDINDKLVLFAGAFTNEVKNPELAQAAVALLPEVKLLELKGYSRSEVALLMNAVDACLMTSHSEGSPQFVKEALACNCPVVSVDVGDVKEQVGDVNGCYIADREAIVLSEALIKVIKANVRIEGTKVIEQKELEQKQVVEKLLKVYSNFIQ